jgi:flagellar L-ring protein precursor FlgH
MNARLLLLAAAVILITGCGATQPVRDKGYAPVEPVVVPPPPQANNGAIYQAGFGMSLFEDTKARRVGDILTINLVEKTTAAKSASTATTKDQDIGISPPTVFGRPVLSGGVEVLNTQVGASRDFAGEGESSQSNQLSGSVTVTVAQVLPNGNLVVRGEKVVTLNQGDEFIRFSGIVRPIDVSSANTVDSTRVADAQITYGGSGVVADANSQGWLARFFQSALFPF